MTIRQAQRDDALEISKLVLSLSHFYLKNKSDELPAWFGNTLSQFEFERRLDNDYFSNFIYLENEIIIAYISMRGENNLYHLFVAEQAQGKGLARKLWQHLRLIRPSKSYSLRSSLYAVPVYQKFGFKKQGPPGEREGICFQKMSLE